MELEVKEVRKSRHIQDETTRMLWGVAAGMCEFHGCRNRLYKHHVTGENVNLAERAHIYAFSEKGKRFSRLLKRDKINDIDNLMLVCGICHKVIDSPNTDYSAKELLKMKKEHEERIIRLTNIKPELKSEVIIYNCNIANKPIRISDFIAQESITPEYYPARDTPVNLSPELRLYDYEDSFWNTMSTDLERCFAQYETSLRGKHISLFAIAPQPLLFKLGTLLNRNYDVSVRQSQGEITKWRWQKEDRSICLELPEPTCGIVNSNKVVITIEISAQLSSEELKDLFCGHRIYRIIATKCCPTAIKSRTDLQSVAKVYREILNKIRLECSPDVKIKLLPLAPSSVSIEIGRQHMKGDPSVSVYDRNFFTKEWASALTF